MHLSRAEKNVLLSGIGVELRRRREKLGISRGALAAKAGVHANVIGRIERGEYNATILVLHAIAGALDASVIKLLEKSTDR